MDDNKTVVIIIVSILVTIIVVVALAMARQNESDIIREKACSTLTVAQDRINCLNPDLRVYR